MADKMTVREASERWNVTERRVSALCKNGKIEGAEKKGKRWLIPSDAEKPSDNRVKTGIYRKQERPAKLPLPIGVSDYRLAVSEYYYIDKTLMIRDFLNERPMVTLFTRPRRFGKTLNMDMLRVFFEKTEADTSVYFRDKKIWACGQKYRDYQGKYPVIFLTFKDVKFETWEETFASIKEIFAKEVRRHEELKTSESLDVYDRTLYEKLASGNGNEVELAAGLLNLSAMLHKHYEIAPVIIIDEYDTPIQQGYMKDYYEKVILFMRNLFSGGFKDNRHLSFGFLTGILRVAKERIFSGLNNLSINSVLDHKYSTYFGFTSDEVKEMEEYYGAADQYNEICAWYDGYRFGRTEIFNPWSVINYFSNECEPRAFWVSTGSNDVIGEAIAQANPEIYERLTSLVNGETFTTYIDTGVIYPQIRSNPSTIYSFLLVTGYLKVLKTTQAFNGDFMCEVGLPNREISLVYHKEILQRMQNLIPQATAISIQEAIFSGDHLRLKKQIPDTFDAVCKLFRYGGRKFLSWLYAGVMCFDGRLFCDFEPGIWRWKV